MLSTLYTHYHAPPHTPGKHLKLHSDTSSMLRNTFLATTNILTQLVESNQEILGKMVSTLYHTPLENA